MWQPFWEHIPHIHSRLCVAEAWSSDLQPLAIISIAGSAGNRRIPELGHSTFSTRWFGGYSDIAVMGQKQSTAAVGAARRFRPRTETGAPASESGGRPAAGIEPQLQEEQQEKLWCGQLVRCCATTGPLPWTRISPLPGHCKTLVLPAVLDAAPGGPDADQDGRNAASISFMNQLVGSVQGRQVDIYDQSRVRSEQSAES